VKEKITESMAEGTADADAGGVSVRAGVGGTTGVDPEPMVEGPVSGELAESKPDAGAPEPTAGPSRRHAETEFPGYVGGFLPDDEEEGAGTGGRLLPQARREEGGRARAEQGAGEEALRERDREAGLVAREQELRAAVKAARPGSEEWTGARLALRRFRAGRTRCVLLPSQTGVRVGERALGDGGTRNLWDNPYSPRSGTLVVGS
jgi:hypothetical protein